MIVAQLNGAMTTEDQVYWEKMVHRITETDDEKIS